uniref:PspC domain-containing protein n=3 Tax=unclassified Prevotella TaxID=2638335 RepID=A0AB33JRW2_9BACT
MQLSGATKRPTDNQTYIKMSTGKRIYRPNNRMIAGVCSGIAAYFDFDPTLTRVLYALLTVFTVFSGVIVYLILWLVMPSE